MRVKGDPIIFVSLLAAVAPLYILFMDDEFVYDFSLAHGSKQKNVFHSTVKFVFQS